MTPIKLSDKFTIYIGKYNNKYSIDEFLKYVDINDKLAKHTNDDSVWIEIETECFQSINSLVKKEIENITNKKFINYAQHYWVYTQKKGFNLEWMHQHLQVHPLHQGRAADRARQHRHDRGGVEDHFGRPFSS
jgi:hypothetical protein